MKTLILTAFLVFAPSTLQAELLTVRDPKAYLQKIDEFLGTVSFDQAYRCGTYAVHWRAKKQQRVRYEIGECSPNKVTVFTTPGEDSSTDTEKVTRGEFERNRGNQVRFFVEKMRNLGNDVEGLPEGSFLAINRLTFDQVLLRNGESAEVASAYVSVVRSSGRTFAAFEISVARNLPMVAQIVEVTNVAPDHAQLFQLLEHGVGEPRKGH
jgi:hypothetical protein